MIFLSLVALQGGSKVKEASTMEHHPENKVGWWQLAKYVNLSTIAMCNTTLFVYFISIWMKQAIQNRCGLPTSVMVLVVCSVAYYASIFFLLKRMIFEVRDGWSS
jgi:hypothetical protein